MGMKCVTPSEIRQSTFPDQGASSWRTVDVVDTKVPAGFPSPAADFDVNRVDLFEQMGLGRPSTFLARVKGDSMQGRGIDDGDLLVIDRALTAHHGHTVVAVLDGELTCKTLYKRAGIVKLLAANPSYPDFVVKEGQSLTLWGVVTNVVKRLVP